MTRDIIDTRNPRTGEVDYQITAVDAAELALIVANARAAQIKWRDEGLHARCRAILKLADTLEAHATPVTQALEIDTGRRKIARGEVFGVIANLRGWAEKAHQLMPEGSWTKGRTKHNFKHRSDYVPYALVGAISPWNFPMILSFIDAIPALLAGGCVIVKPSDVTPRFADALTPVIAEAGLTNILTFVQGGGATGAALVDHVDYVCFTGSVRTGRKVAIRAAENLIPANLELGGKDPLIVTEDANIDEATSLALRASILATGQACQSIERVYVPRTLYEDFVAALVEKAKAVELSYPDISRGHIGPFIFENQADKVAQQIADAEAKGAIVVSGGKVLTHGGGKWLEPTVVRDVNHDMKIMRDETFGPVIPVMAYDTVEEAIALANDSEFGLSGAVYAANIEAAHDIGRHMEVGAVSLMDAALTGQYFEACKQSFKHSGLGPSRMGEGGFLRFFRQKACIANTISPLSIDDFSE